MAEISRFRVYGFCPRERLSAEERAFLKDDASGEWVPLATKFGRSARHVSKQIVEDLRAHGFTLDRFDTFEARKIVGR